MKLLKKGIKETPVQFLIILFFISCFLTSHGAYRNPILKLNGTGNINTARHNGSLFSNTDRFKFNKIPANIIGINYLQGPQNSGFNATAIRNGHIYVLTPFHEAVSQANTLLNDGYEEIANADLPTDFYTDTSEKSASQALRVYHKFVMRGAQISSENWSLLLFSENPIDFSKVLKPTSGFAIKKVVKNKKVWLGSEAVFDKFPSCLNGADFIYGPQGKGLHTEAISLKRGYVYIIAPESNRPANLVETLRKTGYQKLNIPPFAFCTNQPGKFAMYGKQVFIDDVVDVPASCIVVFNSEQLPVTAGMQPPGVLAVVDPPAPLSVCAAERGASVFSDEPAQFDLLPDFLKGKHYVRGPNAGGYVLAARKPGYIYVTAPLSDLAPTGFVKMGFLKTRQLYTHTNETISLYQKFVLAGEKIAIGKNGICFFSSSIGLPEKMAVLETSSDAKITQLVPYSRLYSDKYTFAAKKLPKGLTGLSFLLGSYKRGSYGVAKSAGYIGTLSPKTGSALARETLLKKGYALLSYPLFPLTTDLAKDFLVFTKYVQAGDTVYFDEGNILIFDSIPKRDYYQFPSYTAAEIKLLPGKAFSADTRDWQGCPTIERSGGGRLWAGWFTGGNREPAPENFAVLAISGDDGRSWTDPVIVIKHQDKRVRVEDPQFWTDPLGRLWIFWCQSYTLDAPDLGVWANFDMSLGVWAVVVDNPDAPVDKLKWSTPRRICNGLLRCKPLVLSTGEWMMTPYDCIENNYSNVFVSSDRGASWKFRGHAYSNSDNIYDEQMVVEQLDGSLRMFLRTKFGETGAVSESYSFNKGRTWTEAKDSKLGGANSRIYISRLKSGNILLINHDSLERTRLTAYLSKDDGKSWPFRLLLDDRPDVSYPDAEERPDGLIHVVYDRGRYSHKEILMTTFTEADIIAGTFLSPKAAQKQIISKAYEK